MGRGSSKVGRGWKSQLKAAAKQGKMPRALIGDKQMQSDMLKEINKLYKMPSHDGANIVDQGDGIWVNWKSRVSRTSYPSGSSASEAEKQGALKMLLWNMK